MLYVEFVQLGVFADVQLVYSRVANIQYIQVGVVRNVDGADVGHVEAQTAQRGAAFGVYLSDGAAVVGIERHQLGEVL